MSGTVPGHTQRTETTINVYRQIKLYTGPTRVREYAQAYRDAGIGAFAGTEHIYIADRPDYTHLYKWDVTLRSNVPTLVPPIVA
jgi:hypothetical protein